MRPRYESDQDRTKESAVADKLSERFGVTFVKLPIHSYVDYAALRDGELSAFFEIKCRNNPMTQYPTYMLSLQKVMHGLEWAKFTDKPFILAVQWTDRLGYLIVNRGEYQVSFGGRSDRGDWQDQELVALFPLENFKNV